MKLLLLFLPLLMAFSSGQKTYCYDWAPPTHWANGDILNLSEIINYRMLVDGKEYFKLLPGRDKSVCFIHISSELVCIKLTAITKYSESVWSNEVCKG